MLTNQIPDFGRLVNYNCYCKNGILINGIKAGSKSSLKTGRGSM